ncbi:helix-turn-helix transcriptional regulator [Hespellia stercorisuis]|uniref:Predicted DNA-binding transcriptional regulator YafY, contains an HTH and WYL domains n=1 Tax=Hespellia stercorisuis DSM 15480 TaxID=1121950 RepID=A0A1M6R355_9FIRM|nr:WYL domain-containing protein [Hespellia stercorisuis]SHK26830.1 Predicted DNA-binding transcriptional regulator YafY, contains an HTH and WYL domains [Hespellia stercorisuis DSM 15480]
MPKSYNQKIKILYLMKMFSEETDEKHSLTRNDLEERLAEYGVSTERKSLYNDIDTLKLFGMDIEYRKERPAGYYLASHDFELPELKLLVDAVQSSKFITERKSSSLIKKIESLTSRYEARQLQRQVYVSNRIKTMNESIYYNVDKLHTAIASNWQIRFQYTQWTIEKELKPRRGGGMYQVSPWALTWDDENYYLIAYDENVGILKHFRVDKMLEISILDLPREGQEEFGRCDLAYYTKKTFGMFAGEEQTVRIRFRNSLIGVIIDRFGKEVTVREDGPEHFIARVNIAVSDQFFGWLTGLGDGAEILSPEEVRQEYKGLLKEISQKYMD